MFLTTIPIYLIPFFVRGSIGSYHYHLTAEGFFASIVNEYNGIRPEDHLFIN